MSQKSASHKYPTPPPVAENKESTIQLEFNVNFRLDLLKKLAEAGDATAREALRRLRRKLQPAA